MGARTNIAIVRNGSWDLYYDHWVADRLNVELFWGPEIAIEFVEQREPVERDRWMPLYSYDGCAVIDVDERVLLFYGGDEIGFDVPRRRAWLDLMRENWTDWNVRWAHLGGEAICEYLGVPHDNLHDPWDADEEERFRRPDVKYSSGQCLLTVHQEGACTARRVDGDIESVELGPGYLRVLNEVEPLSDLTWDGEFPHTGCHIDFDAMQMAFWSAEATSRANVNSELVWTGWRTTWLRDEFERHLEIAEMEIWLPEEPQEILQLQALEYLRKNFAKELSNLAVQLAERIGGVAGASTEEARGSVRDDAKMAVIEALEKQIPVGAGRAGLEL